MKFYLAEKQHAELPVAGEKCDFPHQRCFQFMTHMNFSSTKQHTWSVPVSEIRNTLLVAHDKLNEFNMWILEI